MIDEHGYRPNVGIILCNYVNQVFWARRCGQDGWQFPQGGIRANEPVADAMYRELREEVGLSPGHIEILGRTRDWLHYDIPEQYRRRNPHSPFRGQKQIWYLLRLIGAEKDVRLDSCERPEFEEWRWIDYWSALDHIISFKRAVYVQALTELEPLLSSVKSRT
ncbi:MAG: RNA pyrophosphohydrolase [Gammaproteobacteria bacterium]|nr:RNA pyrophosphohydrolase [Gammaproteobacteria bacterium]